MEGYFHTLLALTLDGGTRLIKSNLTPID